MDKDKRFNYKEQINIPRWYAQVGIEHEHIMAGVPRSHFVNSIYNQFTKMMQEQDVIEFTESELDISGGPHKILRGEVVIMHPKDFKRIMEYIKRLEDRNHWPLYVKAREID